MADFTTWLIDSEVLKRAEIDAFAELAKQRNEPLWETLLREGKITEAWLANTFVERLHFPLISFATSTVDPEAVHRIPEALARRHLCLPFACDGRVLRIAMVDPTNLEAIKDIEFFTGLRVQPHVAPRTEVLESIDSNFSRSQAVDFIAEAHVPSEFQVLLPGEEIQLDPDASLRASEIPPIVKLANLVLLEALRSHASDIHIEPAEHELRIRLRVDGVLRDFLQAPEWLKAGLAARLKVMGKLDIAEKRVPQDGRFKVRFKNQVVEVRLSTLPTQFGEKAVMRLLGSNADVRDLDDLGLPAEGMTAALEAVKQPQGMIIVTGPTGSGKSTTLYSLLGRKMSSEVNVVTVEDPIEYHLEGATQVQVKVKSGLTFAACLRSILRQDPDVILVGEIRDRETAEIAFHAAMTGHLVLTTLHTNNSVATILRLLDLGIDPFVITSSVSLVMAQRLTRRICGHCRETYTPNPVALERLKWDDPRFSFTRGRGCVECHSTGFKGRVGIYEMLRMTPGVRAAINRKASEEDIRKAAQVPGFETLLDDARSKIREGITTPEEVLRVIQMQDEAESLCPRCSRPIASETGKCVSCSESTAVTCVGCGQELSADWRLCPRCGRPVLWQPPQSELPLGSDPASSAKGSRRGRTKKMGPLCETPFFTQRKPF